MPYEIKPLEWTPIVTYDGSESIVAYTLFGKVYIGLIGEEWVCTRPDGTHKTKEAAIEAAQRWHDARLLTALREVQP